jgi:hypothetical protein
MGAAPEVGAIEEGVACSVHGAPRSMAFQRVPKVATQRRGERQLPEDPRETGGYRMRS